VGGFEKDVRVKFSGFERMMNELESDEDGIEGIFLRYLGVVMSPEKNKRQFIEY
jgi:hypothetical protein